MAQYRLDIGAEFPLWPDLLSYHGATRLRFDAAKLLLQKAIYEAMHGEALLDRPIAHELMTWANGIDRLPHGHIADKIAGRFRFALERVA